MERGVSHTVDVVIPVYNGAAYIERALWSVVRQDHPPRMIVVVDDGSTDATAEIVARFSSPVPLSYLRKENGGPNSARNAGVRLCTSEFVAFLDADDEWTAHKLSSQVRVFRDAGWDNLGAVYSRYEVIDEESKVIARHFIVEPDPQNRGYIFPRLLEANFISGSASGILIKRECFDRVGLFDETLRGSEDWDMWLRIAQRYQFDFVPEKLVRIRRHGLNNQRDGELMFRQALSFYNKWSEEAVRHGQQFAWSKVIICKVLRDLPHLTSYRQARELLSAEAKENLFRGAFGDFLRFAVANAPRLAATAARHMAGRGDVP